MLNQMRANCINCFRARVDSDDDDDDGSARRRGSSTVERSNTNDDDDYDECVWSTDLEDHFYGQYSMATTRVKQPNHQVYGEVNAKTPTTFVGAYDGHHGDTAAKFLFSYLYKFIVDSLERSDGTVSETVLLDSIQRAEDVFLNSMKVVSELVPADPITGSSVATVGSSCLIGLISYKKLFVANLGDSLAVMYSKDASSRYHSDQLNPEHSLRIDAVRDHMLELNHDDAQDIVRNRLVKGKVVTTRSIGDLYLKDVDFSSIPEIHPRFRLNTPLRRPALSAEPFVSSTDLNETNQFVIFASYGIWSFLTDERAGEIVATKPRLGIARRLIKEALTVAAMRGNPPCTYEHLKTLNYASRMNDYQQVDMMVAVVYFNKDGSLGIERGTGQSSDTTALDEGANVAD